MTVSKEKIEAVLNACRKVTAFIDGPPADMRERLVGLDLVFDELASATTRLGVWEASDDFDRGPECEYGTMRERITPLFPGVGYYWMALELEEMDFDKKNFGLGDMIDDLSEIYKHSIEALVYADQVGDEDGARAFAWSYEYHIRPLIRNAQVYIADLLTKH